VTRESNLVDGLLVKERIPGYSSGQLLYILLKINSIGVSVLVSALEDFKSLLHPSLPSLR